MTKEPLIPTPVVDKNGKLTTIHKKLDPRPVRPQQIPPYKSLPATSKPQQTIYDLRTKDITTKALGGLSEMLGLIQETDETLIPHVNELLESGNFAAKYGVQCYLSFAFNGMASIEGYEDRSTKWEKSCAIQFLDELRLDVDIKWHAGMMAEELTDCSPLSEDYEKELKLQAKKIEKSANNLYDLAIQQYDEVTSGIPPVPDFCRGVVILGLANVPYPETSEDLAQIPPFIEWAGGRFDLKEMLRVVSERRTLNVRTIQGVMDQEKLVQSAFKDGVI